MRRPFASFALFALASCARGTETPQVVNLDLRPTSTRPPVTEEPPATVQPASTITPTPAPSLSLGEPRWMGRGQIVDASFTADGNLLAIGWGSAVSLYSVANAEELWSQSMLASVIAIDARPDGALVAAGLEDGTVLLLHGASGRVLISIGGDPYVYWGDVSWSPDGNWLAWQFTGPGRADPISLFHYQTSGLSEIPNSHVSQGVKPYLAWAPDNSAITLARLGGMCTQVLDRQTGERPFALGTPNSCYYANGVAWSPDGGLLAAARAENGVEFLAPVNGETTTSKPLVGDVLTFPQSDSGDLLFFSPDGKRLASKGGLGYYDYFPLVVWNVETGQRVAQLGQRGNAYDLGLLDRDRLASAFDGESVVSLYASGDLTRWEFTIAEAEEAVISQNPVMAATLPLVWSADGDKLAAPTRSGGAAVWDVATGRQEGTFGPPLTAPALSRDGLLIALTDTENRIGMLCRDACDVGPALADYTALPQAAAFSPDGAVLAYGSRNRVLVHHLARDETLSVLEGYPDDHEITRVLWSPDGGALVAASGQPGNPEAEGQVVLWERKGTRTFEEAFRSVSVRTGYDLNRFVAFSPSGNLVAFEHLPRPVEAAQFSIRIFDRKVGQVIFNLQDYKLAAWVTDEVLLTSEAGFDIRLVQWNVRTRESIVGQARDLGDNVHAPGGIFHASGNSVGNIGRGIEVRRWDSRQVLARVSHGRDIFQISWSPDGRWLASLGADGTIKVWPVNYQPSTLQVPYSPVSRRRNED